MKKIFLIGRGSNKTMADIRKVDEIISEVQTYEEEMDFDESVVMSGDLNLNAEAMKKGSLSDWSRHVKGSNRAERRREAKAQIKGMKR